MIGMEFEGQIESQQTHERRNHFQKNIKTLLICSNAVELAKTDLELVNSLEISCNPHVL